jgi:hypothetical protein
MNTISELNSLYNKLNLKLDNNKDILSKGLYQDVKSLFLWINDNDEDNQENNYIIRHKILFLGNIEILILNEDDKILQNKYFEFIEKMAEISGYNKNLYIKLEFNKKEDKKSLVSNNMKYLIYFNTILLIFLLYKKDKVIKLFNELKDKYLS